MVKTVFALALVAMSGAALAYQPAAETAVQQVAAEEAKSTADEVEESAKDQYRAAAKAFSKCRQNARRDNTPAAAANSCGSQRKRMLAAKEAMQAEK